MPRGRAGRRGTFQPPVPFAVILPGPSSPRVPSLIAYPVSSPFREVVMHQGPVVGESGNTVCRGQSTPLGLTGSFRTLYSGRLSAVTCPPNAFPSGISRKVFVLLLIPLAVRLSRCSGSGLFPDHGSIIARPSAGISQRFRVPRGPETRGMRPPFPGFTSGCAAVCAPYRRGCMAEIRSPADFFDWGPFRVFPLRRGYLST